MPGAQEASRLVSQLVFCVYAHATHAIHQEGLYMVNLNIPASMAEALADRVYRLVEGFETPGSYKGLHIEIDLTRRQGRWELLALAVLLAAG
jgi:hypothetical protein